MWPHSKRGTRRSTSAVQPEDLPDLAAFERNDASLTISMPAGLQGPLDWLSGGYGVNVSDVIRSILFEHLYGRIALDALHDRARRSEREKFARASGEDADSRVSEVASILATVKFSASRGTPADLEHLGASRREVRLELPLRMRDDLARLAKDGGHELSFYIKSVLMKALRGQISHFSWQQDRSRLTGKPPLQH